MTLMERAKRILLLPNEEWPVIDREQATIGSLYTGYIMPLAAIGPVANLIGATVFGQHVAFTRVTYRVPFLNGIRSAALEYVLALLSPYVLALVIDGLAPTFRGRTNQIQALKLAAYSSTAWWVAGVFFLIPALSVLFWLGLYSLVLLYLGMPTITKAPKEQTPVFTAAVVVCAVVMAILFAWIGSRVTWQPATDIALR